MSGPPQKSPIYIPNSELEFLRAELEKLDPHFTNWTRRVKEFRDEGLTNLGLELPLYLLTLWSYHAGGRPIYHFIKRLLDGVVGVFFLILFSPLFLLAAAAIKLSSPGPVFFRQMRIGELGRPFNIFKFRTMTDGADFSSHLKPLEKNLNDPRTTRVGAFLRKYKIDELPQLLNVLKGEMSLIGPRPLTPEDSLTTPNKYLLRFAVRPGCTGYWQALFPNTISPEMKFAADCRYVRMRSLWLDAKLLLLTLPMVLRGERDQKPKSFDARLRKQKPDPGALKKSA